MILELVTKKFDILVGEICKTKEAGVLEFINDHPKRQTCINNLCKQVTMYELNFPPRRMNDLAKRKRQVHVMIAGITELFIDLAMKQRHQHLASSAEKTRLANQSSAKTDAEQIMTEVPNPTSERKPGEKSVVFE